LTFVFKRSIITSVNDPARPRQQLLLPASLTACTILIAAVMLSRGVTSTIEAFSCVAASICSLLIVCESAWNFPFSLANVITFAIIFFRQRLYADASLQIVYLCLTIYACYRWLRGGPGGSRLKISSASSRLLTMALGACVLIWLPLWLLLSKKGDVAPLCDSLTTAISLTALWMLSNKYLENWWLWIGADLIYIPLYFYKGLDLTGVLYCVFLCMSITGVIRWRRSWQSMNHAKTTPDAVVPVPVEALSA
jgi:nicotinamide mononucleotide transporter